MAVTQAPPTQRVVASRDELNRIASRYRRRSKHSFGSVTRKILFWLLVVVIVVYSLFPFYWAIVSSLTPDALLYTTPVKFWPQGLTWDHYRQIFTNGPFLHSLANSAIVSFVTVLIALFLGTVGAYALGRLHFRGRSIVLYVILSMTMFPAVAIIGSLFLLARQFHLYNTLIALVLTYLSFTVPFTVWVLTNFFKAMPDELEQAAMVDGATPMRALWQILLPMAVPGLVTTGLLAFIAAWSEFIYALTLTLPGGSRQTVQVAIANFTGQTQFEQPYALKMAAAVVVTIPLLVGVLLVQRRIVSGLTAGAIKG